MRERDAGRARFAMAVEKPIVYLYAPQKTDVKLTLTFRETFGNLIRVLSLDLVCVCAEAIVSYPKLAPADLSFKTDEVGRCLLLILTAVVAVSLALWCRAIRGLCPLCLDRKAPSPTRQQVSRQPAVVWLVDAPVLLQAACSATCFTRLSATRAANSARKSAFACPGCVCVCCTVHTMCVGRLKSSRSCRARSLCSA